MSFAKASQHLSKDELGKIQKMKIEPKIQSVNSSELLTWALFTTHLTVTSLITFLLPESPLSCCFLDFEERFFNFGLIEVRPKRYIERDFFIKNFCKNFSIYVSCGHEGM